MQVNILPKDISAVSEFERSTLHLQSSALNHMTMTMTLPSAF